MIKKQKNSPKLYKSPKHHTFMMFSDPDPVSQPTENQDVQSAKEQLERSQRSEHSEHFKISEDVKTESTGCEYNMSGMTKLLEMYLEAVTINESNYNNINKKLEKISYKLDSLTKDQTNKRDKLLHLKSQLIKEQSLVKNKTKELLENIAHATYTASQEL